MNCVLVRGFWHCMVLIDHKHAFETDEQSKKKKKNIVNESCEVGSGCIEHWALNSLSACHNHQPISPCSLCRDFVFLLFFFGFSFIFGFEIQSVDSTHNMAMKRLTR